MITTITKTVVKMRCWCCNRWHEKREELSDPWEGRMDGYCNDCADNRCDCYPEDCPVKYGF